MRVSFAVLKLGGFAALLVLSAGSLYAQHDEEALKRSSHPRGIASDGRPPSSSIATQAPLRVEVGKGASSVAGASVAPAPPSRQTAQEGVNVTGTTRIDARAREATAASAGQHNAAGNRVGSVGGK